MTFLAWSPNRLYFLVTKTLLSTTTRVEIRITVATTSAINNTRFNRVGILFVGRHQVHTRAN